MKLYKKSERVLRVDTTLQALRETGCETKHVGEFDKWKEIAAGKIQATINVYCVKNEQNGKEAYLIGDTLGRVAAPFVFDKEEVVEFLREHGYKGDQQWYTEDCGMTEETWNVWTGKQER